MSAAHTPGPVQTLARLSIQSLRYIPDEEFRNAVDAVISKPVFDAAPDLLKACQAFVIYDNHDDFNGIDMMLRYEKGRTAIRAAIAKATGVPA